LLKLLFESAGGLKQLQVVDARARWTGAAWRPFPTNAPRLLMTVIAAVLMVVVTPPTIRPARMSYCSGA